ncbi:MAG: hypothetical protein HRU35_07380 [Rickettsiaceae bacterium]|nr:hypothetical protein [Rickettsiaceae bacterium]
MARKNKLDQFIDSLSKIDSDPLRLNQPNNYNNPIIVSLCGNNAEDHTDDHTDNHTDDHTDGATVIV